MDRTERCYKIELLIRKRGGVNCKSLSAELGVSRATLGRELLPLRERIDTPMTTRRAG